MICAVFPLGLLAQQRTEYNRKGDEAMKRLDYSDAKMWYEEGVSQCDAYSIDQLTTIWLSNERMRPSMRSLMNKCLNCLTVKATEDDPDAISKLIIYYAEPAAQPIDSAAVSPKKRMEFFAGYSYSIESPYGITVGGMGQRFGWYVRFKTNMSFMNYTDECNNQGQIIKFSNSEGESYELNTGKSSKTNSIAGTAGLIVKCFPWLYASVGLGYGERALLHSFTTHSYENYDSTREVWCRNIDSSYKGVAAEVDLMMKITNSVFISVGCNTVNFKYLDLNAGLGVFF